VVDDTASVKALYEEIGAIVGERGLDYLVNNAGRSKSLAPPLVPRTPVAEDKGQED
jgi:NAD(P)-dependent dehydrogenase (short-subunit alcohol dehydrogenase family)